MSILVKAGEQYLQISDDDLARCMISPQEFETKSADGAVRRPQPAVHHLQRSRSDRLRLLHEQEVLRRLLSLMP